MKASTTYVNVIHMQASIGKYLEGMSALHWMSLKSCWEALMETSACEN